MFVRAWEAAGIWRLHPADSWIPGRPSESPSNFEASGFYPSSGVLGHLLGPTVGRGLPGLHGEVVPCQEEQEEPSEQSPRFAIAPWQQYASNELLLYQEPVQVRKARWRDQDMSGESRAWGIYCKIRNWAFESENAHQKPPRIRNQGISETGVLGW